MASWSVFASMCANWFFAGCGFFGGAGLALLWPGPCGGVGAAGFCPGLLTGAGVPPGFAPWPCPCAGVAGF